MTDCTVVESQRVPNGPVLFNQVAVCYGERVYRVGCCTCRESPLTDRATYRLERVGGRSVLTSPLRRVVFDESSTVPCIASTSFVPNLMTLQGCDIRGTVETDMRLRMLRCSFGTVTKRGNDATLQHCVGSNTNVSSCRATSAGAKLGLRTVRAADCCTAIW